MKAKIVINITSSKQFQNLKRIATSNTNPHIFVYLGTGTSMKSGGSN